MTPIHLAAINNHPFCITFLVQKGCNIDQQDNNLETPLHKACQMGLDDVIYYILAWTKDLDIKDVNGETALHHAVKNSGKAVHANVRAMK